jgi:hypothetical protein
MLKFTIAIVLTLVGHYLLLNYQCAQKNVMLQQIANQILVDQVNDLHNELLLYKNTKTYEDGLLIGIQMGESALYTEGYHKGLQHGADHRNVGSEYTYVSE